MTSPVSCKLQLSRATWDAYGALLADNVRWGGEQDTTYASSHLGWASGRPSAAQFLVAVKLLNDLDSDRRGCPCSRLAERERGGIIQHIATR
jgi:hypothetical protein